METTLALATQDKQIIVNGTSVTPSISNGADWRQIVAYFLLSMDVKESSMGLYKRTITHYFDWIEKTHRTLANVTEADIKEYKDYLQGTIKEKYRKNFGREYFKDYPELKERNLSALTTGSYLIAVRKFYEFAEAYKLYPNVAKRVKTPHKRNEFKKHYLHETEITNLLDYYKEKNLRDFAIVNLILRTGLRTIEVVRANVEHIDFMEGRRVLKVWGKGHDEPDDIVVLTDEAYEPIKEYLETYRKGAKGAEPLFTSNSYRVQGGRLCTKTISCLCKEGLKAIGLNSHSYTAHSLRHTTACMILKAGGTEFNVQEVLRHSSVNTSQIYMESLKKERRIQNAPEALLSKMF